MALAIKADLVSKAYQLGQIGTGTVSRDIERWWAKLNRREDPFQRIGEEPNLIVPDGSMVWSLKDISFEIEQGSTLGIIGRNGAGKSTLLKLLSRITAPTSGVIKIKGRIASLLEVGTGFHPELTGRENIYLNGAILGMRKNEIHRKLEEIIDFSGVEKYIDTPVKRYSSGMYVRLAFAVAAHLESDILVVDEVLAVGDAEFQKKCLGKMGEVSRGEGRTILFVSHNMIAINTLCHKVLLLEKGHLTFLGDTQEGIKKYLNQNIPDLSNLDVINKIAGLREDEVFKLLRMQVFQEDTNGLEFYSDKPVTVSIDYSVKIETRGLRIGFDLVEAETGSLIFRTFHDELENEITPVPIGNYLSKAQIPANLLSEGMYHLSLSIGVHNVRWIVFDSVKVLFRINNISGVNRIYSEKRPGIINPAISWLTGEK